MSQQTELALIHRLMHDLDSVVIPGQHDLQAAAMCALAALAQNIKLRFTPEQLQAEQPRKLRTVIKPNGDLAI